ncbi:MAG TPA: hypothetical protein VMW79_10885 [Anaerolineae bacterium]|nr:hypothetical protein [Anaerolineae bacterium]
MPTPIEQRIYHAKIEEKDGLRVIDNGTTLVETIGPWHTHIGRPGEAVHSTKFFPPERVLVPESMAEHLVKGNAAVILGTGAKARKKGPAPENKLLVPQENKADDDGLLEE